MVYKLYMTHIGDAVAAVIGATFGITIKLSLMIMPIVNNHHQTKEMVWSAIVGAVVGLLIKGMLHMLVKVSDKLLSRWAWYRKVKSFIK
jgi:uncharacterized membrane protein YciS (DUF1049 family)